MSMITSCVVASTAVKLYRTGMFSLSVLTPTSTESPSYWPSQTGYNVMVISTPSHWNQLTENFQVFRTWPHPRCCPYEVAYGNHAHIFCHPTCSVVTLHCTTVPLLLYKWKKIGYLVSLSFLKLQFWHSRGIITEDLWFTGGNSCTKKAVLWTILEHTAANYPLHVTVLTHEPLYQERHTSVIY